MLFETDTMHKCQIVTMGHKKKRQFPLFLFSFHVVCLMRTSNSSGIILHTLYSTIKMLITLKAFGCAPNKKKVRPELRYNVSAMGSVRAQHVQIKKINNE